MMLFLKIADVIFIVFGILFLFFPEAVVKISKLANEMFVYPDEKVYSVRKISGIVCLILAAFLTAALMKLYHMF